MTHEQLMTTEDVAQHLNVAEQTVCDWAEKGEIPCGKIGDVWRFRCSDIDHWLDKRLCRPARDMSLTDISLEEALSEERVLFLENKTKRSALLALIDCLAAAREVGSREDLLDAVFQREALMSTGIGLGIGVPHVRLPSIKDIVMAVGLCKVPLVDYESLDGEPVRLIFMIAAGREQHAQHIRLLSLISSKCKVREVRDAMFRAREASELMAILLNPPGVIDGKKRGDATCG